ncbi:MAG: Bro-N domain-containing protein [Haemophilus parahaemolyticus]|uniref:BRO-N domain-containing protein n=1 Tax=Haemophilus parahaemolyticus TaxID=735 RepID=UPI00204685AE|nr:Bro-N domain-containing protein [Haemophilus parahaemolyticus]MDQ6573929.1 Bro-N domain-containing protein [Haemophilus parahaemolyticus]DAY50992.1 MAG TPA: repressor domain protein [Caudoviricetes sp.]
MTTQNQLSTFNFHNSPVRTITDPKGEIWFCDTDVYNILGYQNSRKALQDHCKEAGVTKRYTPTTSGNQEITFINEPNLYRLIIKSRKPEAERFEAWVFEEVLPQIRKTGSYSQNTHEIRPLEITLKVQMLDNLYYMAKNASELCHQYRKMMNDIINTLNIEYFRPSKPDYKYQLVSEMQFALDDVEVILKTHTREQTAKNIELARLRRSF